VKKYSRQRRTDKRNHGRKSPPSEFILVGPGGWGKKSYAADHPDLRGCNTWTSDRLSTILIRVIRAIRGPNGLGKPDPNYANSSLITLPLLAIFIGRPLLLVNVVSSEMPSALHTVAMTSCEV